MLMRGGTSKGAYFLAEDLPGDRRERDALLLRIMGSPDPRQIDGIGGAHPLTSKVAVISPSDVDDADVDYLFLQVGVDEPIVTDRQNCGNLLAGVGPFAIERGLVPVGTETTRVRIHMVNTGGRCTATVRMPGGVVSETGDLAIEGVPGTAAPIGLDFLDVEGSSTGALFPTGSVRDEIYGVPVTCVDAGMPSVIVSRPRSGGAITARTFIPHRVHQSIGVLGALTLAAGALAVGSVAHDCAALPATDEPFVAEHPTGSFAVDVALAREAGRWRLTRAASLRTARTLFDGRVFPAHPTSSLSSSPSERTAS